MPRYSEERKQTILSKLLPPLSLSVAEVSRSEGIGLQTLYNWRAQAREQGHPMPSNHKTPDDWSSETKLATIIETATLSESELSEYCRSKGLYVEQIKAWRDALQGFSSSKQQSLKDKRQQQSDRKQIKQLTRELARKEKALAETAALLVLRKKLEAFWEEHEDD